ncbi:hypothetical protein FQN55_002965 [Onygenales sp. PD_40]|nr:hypothetical protein FQN55_002965 [Onygenales sp. PD_40]
MKLLQPLLAASCLFATMALGDSKPGAVELSPDDKATVDALAGYGVDVGELIDLSELPPPTERSCRAISTIFPDQVFQPNSTAYTEWRNEFWSQQQSEVQPACIFQPASSPQVAIAFLIAKLTRCQFAVKSGGHAAFTGASSIPNGLTIDLVRLNTIQLSSDKKSAEIGAGNRYLDVYEKLAPEGLVIVGGRVSDLGVGGFTLGGGITFYTAQYGFACDNVNNYEVVVADGRILQVNPQSHPDLYWALRGGGNNFGIVTKFDLAAYPAAGSLWAGSRIYLADDNNKKAILNAVANFADESHTDPKAALICNFAYNQGMFVAAVNLEYAEPVENPTILKPFGEIPQLMDTMGIKTLPEVVLEFKESNPNGLRQSYWTLTFNLDIEMMTYVVDSYMAGVDPIKNVAGIVPALTLQIFTSDMMEKMSKNGGNALGLSPSDGPLLLVLVNVMWADKADDEAVVGAIAGIIEKIKTEAKAKGKLNDYIYMNYASQFQSVVESYGKENHERLLKVAEEYDCNGVFQTLQPGYFKLSGAPVENAPAVDKAAL